MFISDPRDALAVAHGRGRALRQERATEAFRRTTARRGASLAALLRRAAEHLDPAPVVRRPA